MFSVSSTVYLESLSCNTNTQAYVYFNVSINTFFSIFNNVVLGQEAFLYTSTPFFAYIFTKANNADNVNVSLTLRQYGYANSVFLAFVLPYSLSVVVTENMAFNSYAISKDSNAVLLNVYLLPNADVNTSLVFLKSTLAVNSIVSLQSKYS